MPQAALRMSQIRRRLPVGADPQPDGSTHFRVWAPKPRDVALVIDDANGKHQELALTNDGGGYFTALVPDVGPGRRDWYRLDRRLLADPDARVQASATLG